MIHHPASHAHAAAESAAHAGVSRSAVATFAILGTIGVIGSAAAWVLAPRQFYFSYLSSYAFVLTTVLGMLFFIMLHHVTDAGWSTVIRRSAEHVLAAVPALLVLIAPILLGLHWLYEWSHAEAREDELLAAKAPYLNVPFLLVRLAVYFAAWLLLSWIFRGRSLKQDGSGDPAITLSLRRWSAPGFFIFAITFTFASIDLLMSLEPHWFSTVFGVYVFSGAVVASLCVMILITLGLVRSRLAGMVSTDQLHDLGRLLFAFSVFWAYIAFSQYFLVWYANVPEETVYFLRRWQGGWRICSILLPVGRFALPFLVLMSGSSKRRPGLLAAMGIVLLTFHWLDMYWMVMPVLHPDGPAPAGWLVDAATVLAIGGTCGLAVLWSMSRHALYPRHDPRLHEALAAAH